MKHKRLALPLIVLLSLQIVYAGDAYGMRHTQLGRFVQLDPTGYPDGMNGYAAWHIPSRLFDPSGTVSQGAHHPYPLHLGGAKKQPLYPMTDVQHQKAHAYFKEKGFGFGKAGRAKWKALTSAQQRAHIRASLQAAGVNSGWINRNIDSAMKGATPGVKTPRTAGGFTTPGAMKAMAGSAIVMATATAGYNYYLSAANGLAAGADRISLCRELQEFDRDAILTNELKVSRDNTSFQYIATDGIVYSVNIRSRNGGCCCFTASYVRDNYYRGGFMWTRKYWYRQTVDVLKADDHDVIDRRCPANARNPGDSCKRF